MTPDLLAVGAAALVAQHQYHLLNDAVPAGCPEDANARLLAVGRAVIAAMVPPTEPDGTCGDYCVFASDASPCGSCNLRWGEIDDKGLNMRPGPQCPAVRR